MKLLGSSIKGWEQLSERRHFTKQYLWHLKQAAPFLYVMSRRRWHGSINTNTSNNWFMNLQLMSNHSDLEVIDYHKVYSCWTCSWLFSMHLFYDSSWNTAVGQWSFMLQCHNKTFKNAQLLLPFGLEVMYMFRFTPYKKHWQQQQHTLISSHRSCTKHLPTKILSSNNFKLLIVK